MAARKISCLAIEITLHLIRCGEQHTLHSFKMTPLTQLIHASKTGRLDVVRTVLEQHTFSDGEYTTALKTAAAFGWGQVAHHLMSEYGFHRTALVTCASIARDAGFSSCANMIRTWAATGRPTKPFSPPAFMGIRGFVSVYDVDPSDHIETHNLRYALCRAAEHGHEELVCALLNHEVVRSSDKDDAFRMAAWAGRTRVVDFMLRNAHISADSIKLGMSEAARRGMMDCWERMHAHQMSRAPSVAAGAPSAYTPEPSAPSACVADSGTSL